MVATSRFYGAIGYGTAVEQAAGVYDDEIVERFYYGNIIRNTRQLQNGDSVNDELTVQNSISIVADPYASEHFFAIRYIRWAGTLWKVSDVEVQSPRLILRLGGIYNGPTAAPSTP
jgi:hypothetical protein